MPKQESGNREFTAKALYIRISPYKLRPIADAIRGKSVSYTLGWLATYDNRRVAPIKKLIESAAANARDLENIGTEALKVKEIRIDQGPIHKYFKPGAMGRANIQRKRLSHLSVILDLSFSK